MKTSTLLAAMLAAFVLSASAEVVSAKAGDSVLLHSDDVRIYDKDLNRLVVRSAPKTQSSKEYFATRAVTIDETKDVVKALEILAKHVPTEYRESTVTLSSWVTGDRLSIINSSYHSPKTKADDLRDEARKSEDKANALRSQATAWEKEKKQIDWALKILAQWKDRLAAID